MMNPRGAMARVLRTVLRAVEGQPRPGPYFLPVSGGWLPDGAPENWWQTGYTLEGGLGSRSAMVEACVSAYAQTVAMCPGTHWRLNSKNGRDRVKTSALSRILVYPNDYQSASDFMLNAVRSLYMDGNAYALALRNDRFEVDELHLMNPYMSRAYLAVNGDIFYRLAGNHVIAQRMANNQNEQLMVPARDVLHVRLHVNHRYPYPLVGESPILSTIDNIQASNAMLQQQIAFYMNQARPAAVLTTDMVLDTAQVQFLRDRWDEQTKGLNQGKTPILTGGLKPQPWGVPAGDAELAEVLKLSQQNIALAFRIPLQIFGLGGSGASTGFNTTEALMNAWIASGLGFCLNHVEEAYGVLFNLKGQPDEYVEFDTKALLRSAMTDRINALTKGVQGGIFAPNEARNQEGLESVPYGDEPRVQQQVVPLSAAGSIPAPHAPPGSPPSAAVTLPPSSSEAKPSSPEAKPSSSPPPKAVRYDRSHEIGRLFASAAGHERRRERYN
jgi:HK97 family phage portal protein